ncbi:MAG: hypothetical protein REI09_14540, partial [Candidatus Dactylopiibacterium sp.]|nr:hypothetical protein [Candidatus Dactylopiibacterium sp.]
MKRIEFSAAWRAVLMAALLLPLGLSSCAFAESPLEREAKARSARAKVAREKFEAYCKTAGEKIYRTAQNVEGVFLLKIRQTSNFGKQFEMDDPYGHDSTGNRYIESFLAEKIRPRGNPPEKWRWLEVEFSRNG